MFAIRAHRLYDPGYEGCGFWECCPPWYEVRAILTTTANFPAETPAAPGPDSTAWTSCGEEFRTEGQVVVPSLNRGQARLWSAWG
ncbi:MULTISPECIES: hypothetical protein [Kribbella]|uniref:hypothetical protein n=1 Tax=Kribbella TaxID=182639 RepID=UPI001052E3D2|nr:MULTISPECIES: hypothetical protein [Kribbella]